MPTRKLDVTIVGAGIGGLTAAICLRRAGHYITIYEKSSLSHEVGQGITISPNGGRILRDLGLDFGKARTIDYNGTNIVSAVNLEARAEEQDCRDWKRQFGVGMKTAYRIDLHAALVELATATTGEGEPVNIVTTAGVKDWNYKTGTVTFESGRMAEADLVIAADGVKSTAAAHINGPDCPEIDSSGTIVFRFILPKELILSDPLTKPLLDAGPGMCSFNVSPTADRWLVRYWCRDDGLQNFALYSLRTHDDAEKQEHDLRFRTDRDSLKREMEGFHPALLRLADLATDVLPLWRCTTREPLRKLSKGRMVVIGDAAHPVKPHIGQGAISAIEDAAVLGTLFKDVPETGELSIIFENRLQLFDKLRIGRVAAYKYYSDVPFFRNAVEEQKEKCEKFMKPDELPGEIAFDGYITFDLLTSWVALQSHLRPWYMRFDVREDAECALRELAQTNEDC